MRQALVRIFRATEAANYDALVELARRSPCPDGDLLDCGCGDGAFTARLADAARPREAWGVEAVQDRVDEANRRGIRAVRHDLNQPLPFDDGRFAMVHANQLLEHLAGTDDFLRELKRVLAPGGHLLLSTNNLASWHNVASLALGYQPFPMHVSGEAVLGNPLDPLRGHRFTVREDSHLRIFSWRGLLDLVTWHGFEVVHFRTVGYYPFPTWFAAWIGRIDRRHGVFLTAQLRKPRT